MAHSRVELSKGWSFRQHDGPANAWLPVTKVPTQVHLDLLANKKIPDPFLDLNERAVQWVGEKAWVYRLAFEAPASALDPHATVTTDLVFEGLDTFATVWLNGKKILKADNMFISHRVNVTDIIKAGTDNVLEILFDSALLRGRELVNEHSHEHNFLVRQTEAGRIPTRKAQYNWGWDWGPILMTSGPWKPVYLEQYVARLDDFWPRYTLTSGNKHAQGTISVQVAGNVQKSDKVSVSLSVDGKYVVESESVINDDLTTFSFKIPDVQLWYPFGYGSQTRYALEAKLIRNDLLLDRQSKLVGFRKVALVQEDDDHGKSFYFRINDIDVFAGGSCWIPTDSFQANISSQRYRNWVKLMREGNQVMVRIWGGGVYEDDAFLDACDELGILVWNDFQFACASYPTYPSFLKNFEKEARQQVRRMRWHPAAVIWAGNNEDYQVQERYKLDYDFKDKDPQSWLKSSFPARYIYEYLLPKIIEEEDDLAIYHPSSPWGDGKPTADPTVGDIHQWNLWHGNMNKYQEASSLVGRFVSEFGMEAYPHVSTINRMIADPSQRYPGSMAMDFHNKAIGHERRMLSYVAENFQLRTDLAAFTHLTQMVQADTMRFAYKAWRRDWKDRKCGGVLVWQLNDCWPTMSWAVVDYYLVKKPAFYAIARALRKIDIGVSRTVHDWTSVFVDKNSNLSTGQVDHTAAARGGSFDVWVASSDEEPTTATVTVRFISISSGKDVHPTLTKNTMVEPNTTTEVVTSQTLPASIPHAKDGTVPFDHSVWEPYVIHATLHIDNALVASDTAWPDPIKYVDFPARGLSFDISSAKDQVTVSAERPVKGFVFEEVEGGWLSDNGFDVVPGETQAVQVKGALKVDELRWTYVGAPGGSMEIPRQTA